MPYKNHKDQVAQRRRWYLANKDLVKERAIANTTKYRERNIRYVNGLKSNPCVDCGHSFDPVCMDFDHREGEEKLRAISKMVRLGNSIVRITREIAKCDLVCSNCHRIRTRDRSDWLNLCYRNPLDFSPCDPLPESSHEK